MEGLYQHKAKLLESTLSEKVKEKEMKDFDSQPDKFIDALKKTDYKLADKEEITADSAVLVYNAYNSVTNVKTRIKLILIKEGNNWKVKELRPDR